MKKASFEKSIQIRLFFPIALLCSFFSLVRFILSEANVLTSTFANSYHFSRLPLIMSKPFLSAEWRNLLMANYAIDPNILKPYLPCHTELDSFNGIHYVSLVGFLFANTKVKGIGFPFHRTFEEVNLRFYVRYKEDKEWKRGVVFMKEIVPRRMISFVANTIYGEKYATHVMTHLWNEEGNDLQIEYKWKVDNDWNYIKAVAQKEPSHIKRDSEEEFITEHYWGYTYVNQNCTGVYEVQHPKWRVHQVKSYDIQCSVRKLYGKDFEESLNQKPLSVFLAEGSPIKVMSGSKIVGINS